MDPFNMPSWGSAPNYQSDLEQTVSKVAPLAQNWNGVQNGVSVQQVFNKAPSVAPTSNLSKFAHFIGGIGSEIGHIASGAATWLGKNLVNTVTAPGKLGVGLSHAWQDNFDINQLTAQTQQNSDTLNTLYDNYKSGRITAAQYKIGINELAKENNVITQQQVALNKRIAADKQDTYSAAIDTASTLVTILTAGFGKAASVALSTDGAIPVAEKTAANYLSSSSAHAFLNNVESGLNKIATDPELFAKLSPAAQKATQAAVADVVASNGGTMTASQIARASAVNLALKYPIYFNMMSTTGQDIYHKLDDKKYGEAVRSLAFNAALLLSGGPIGQALKYGGKAISGIGGRTFGSTAFLDELSKGIGDGNSAGLYEAINSIKDSQLRREVIQNLSAVEATNMAAVHGKDAVAAAWRVLNGMASYEGASMSQFTHEEALNNMVNFAKAQRIVDEVGKANNLGPITVGRVDARQLNEISAHLSPISDTEVAAPGEPIFHGTSSDLKDITELTSGKSAIGDNGKNLIYVTHNKDIARNFGDNVLEGRLSGKVLDTSKLGDPHDPNKVVVPEEFSDYKTTPLLDGRDRMVFEQSYLKGDVRNYVVDMRPGINDYLKSKGYSAVTIPRTNSDVAGQRTETIVFDGSAIKSSKVNQDVVESRLQAWEQLKAKSPTQAWAHNDNFDRQIKSLISRYRDSAGLDAAIRSIKASFQVKGFPKATAKQLSKMGYIPIKPVNLEAPFQEGTGKLSTSFTSKSDDFFLRAVQPLPVLSSVGSLLTRMGLSPNASSSRVYQLFNEGLAENLSRMKVVKSFVDKGASDTDTADNIVKTLSNYAHNPTRGVKLNGKPLAPITDLRQLTTKDIMEALQVSHKDAQEVKGALMDAMLQVPLKVRGLGDKLVDVNYKLNPLAGKYARIQGAARFSWNPFFQAKLAYKTELLAQAQANGKFPTMGGTNTILSMIFPDKYKEIDNVRGLLRSAGVFDEKAAFGEGLSGEAVNDVGVAGANLTHKLIPSQERSIASMVQVQADKVGLSTEDFIKKFPNEVRDTVQMIAQYDRNSDFLNSAMARTLNLAFFPFRFEYKVASIMARSLSRTNPMTQLAVINGLYRAHDWLNSPEGQAWYSQNSEVIGLIKYFTPIQTLGEVSTLLGMHPDSVGSFGELGGLPFGWIPQMLDAQGLTHFGAPYINPKTGTPVPDYIPATDKAKLAAAIQDLIGSLYSYPGATVGLHPTKTDINRAIALGITGTNKSTDFTKSYPGTSEQDQDFASTIQGLSSQTIQGGAQTNIQTRPQPSQLTPTTQVPAQPSPLTTPRQKPGSGSSKKKKKSEFTPELLPGQTSLGQL